MIHELMLLLPKATLPYFVQYVELREEMVGGLPRARFSDQLSQYYRLLRVLQDAGVVDLVGRVVPAHEELYRLVGDLGCGLAMY